MTKKSADHEASSAASTRAAIVPTGNEHDWLLSRLYLHLSLVVVRRAVAGRPILAAETGATRKGRPPGSRDVQGVMATAVSRGGVRNGRL